MTEQTAPVLELGDMQGLIARGYGHLKAASYLLLQIDDSTLARQWLARIAPEVTRADARPIDAALNLAVSATGLKKLDLPAGAFQMFPYEFRTGMTTSHRRRMFGDVNSSAPEHWLWGGPTTPTVDVLLLLFASDTAELARRYANISSGLLAGGVSEILHLETVVDLDGREHFGFVDGISQPTIPGLSSRQDIPPNTVAPGEFILGYVNEYGRYTDRPLLAPSADPNHILAADVEGSGRADFGRNGTFLVFRQLSQDVHGFWRYMEQTTRRADGSSDPEKRTWLAAKLVGRWPSGAPLTLAPDADDPELANANDFTYHNADEFGLNCPIGAHVRRSHPRDSLDPDPGTARSFAIDKRHRLLRRGREYGPQVDDPFAPAPLDDPERGLYFICLVGNIARQFEFVQHTWLSNPKFDGLYDEPDPLVASHAGSNGSFSIPADPVRIRHTDLPSFVTVRGGGYFFLPGIRTLDYLASDSRAANTGDSRSLQDDDIAEELGLRQPGKTSSPFGS